MKRTFIFVLAMALTLVVSSSRAAAPKGVILVEAESFADHGGWVLDQQFMDQMGSPYLLAHGLGNPVKDATTEIQVEQAGSYKLWVRTKDWVAQWKAPGTPGKFQVLIGGKAVETTFGTEGAEWHWQAGGSVQLPAGAVKLALHDLTGFEGRCDAILFSLDHAFTPSNDLKELTAFRRAALGIPDQPEDAGSYDLVVVGGGIPGMCASLAAARLGLKVALIQDRPVFGGNNSSEVRVWLNGGVRMQPYPHIGDVVAELEPAKRAHAGETNTAEIYEDGKRMALMQSEKNLTLFMEYRMNQVESEGKKITAVVAQSTRSGKRVRLAGRLFADCTGDGDVGAGAGADFEVTQTQHMGPSNLWNTADAGSPQSFPRCPWAIDLTHKPFPGRVMKKVENNPAKAGAQKAAKKAAKPGNPLDQLGQWYWETGFDWDPVKDTEKMRDYNLRAMYGAWDALKNVDQLYPNHKLNWAAFVTGKRESRRLLGDVLLSEQDFIKKVPFEDACYPCTWTIDLHYPEPRYVKGFEGNAFLSYATHGKYQVPYWAPYRTLYSRNIENLFMAGRDISVTHLGMGPTRVMRTGGMMGEIVGMAASICVKQNTTPRGVYEQHLGELKALMEKGVGKPKAAK